MEDLIAARACGGRGIVRKEWESNQSFTSFRFQLLQLFFYRGVAITEGIFYFDIELLGILEDSFLNVFCLGNRDLSQGRIEFLGVPNSLVTYSFLERPSHEDEQIQQWIPEEFGSFYDSGVGEELSQVSPHREEGVAIWSPRVDQKYSDFWLLYISQLETVKIIDFKDYIKTHHLTTTQSFYNIINNFIFHFLLVSEKSISIHLYIILTDKVM